VDQKPLNLKMSCVVTRARPALPDCCLCVYILAYESVSVTPQPWDEISEDMTEERSEIEENNNTLFHFHREFRYWRSQNRGRGINDDHDSKWFAFRSRLFLKGQTPIQDINKTLVLLIN
jgi:hypothetical protein